MGNSPHANRRPVASPCWSWDRKGLASKSRSACRYHLLREGEPDSEESILLRRKFKLKSLTTIRRVVPVSTHVAAEHRRWRRDKRQVIKIDYQRWVAVLPMESTCAETLHCADCALLGSVPATFPNDPNGCV